MKKFFSIFFITIFLVFGVRMPNASAVDNVVEVQQIERLQDIAGVPQGYFEVSNSGNMQLNSYIDSGCTLYPSEVHLRKSGGYGTIGAKPYTKCNFRVQKIHHNSALYIVEWGGLSYKKMTDRSQVGYNISSMELKSLEWSCKNSNKSKFQQITYGEVTINGKTIRTVVQTAKKDENCGY
ncbi:hypothetical protein [Rothia nasimurium]|uniref:hypothetical protein n=1 Tax=Rothia nasimurium TaxID=85336 RepID=UPI002DD65EC7|nr:hypothetical protein [Rothia nasimurium]